MLDRFKTMHGLFPWSLSMALRNVLVFVQIANQAPQDGQGPPQQSHTLAIIQQVMSFPAFACFNMLCSESGDSFFIALLIYILSQHTRYLSVGGFHERKTAI
jgi:hypothetical protein